MLKESRFGASRDDARESSVDELTIGLKHKLHLRARTAPYYLRRPEDLPQTEDLLERLLQERALVAEAVRRLQALQDSTQGNARTSKCPVDS